MSELPHIPSPRVNYAGPFSSHNIVVDGWKIPLLHAHLTGDGSVMLVLDDRLAATFTIEEAERIVPFLADCIAVAMGFSCHPNENDEKPNWLPNPRPVRV